MKEAQRGQLAVSCFGKSHLLQLFFSLKDHADIKDEIYKQRS